MNQSLEQLISQTVEQMGYLFWGLEQANDSHHRMVLRVYIDCAKDDKQGILIEDCQAVSEQLGPALDASRSIDARYTLEVSSPGVERQLFTPDQFAAYQGERVRLWLDSKKRCSGQLISVGEQGIEIKITDGTVLKLDFSEIRRAKLIAF